MGDGYSFVIIASLFDYPCATGLFTNRFGSIVNIFIAAFAIIIIGGSI